jgi:hypothetical protein
VLVLVIVMGRARFLERRALRASISGVLGGDSFRCWEGFARELLGGHI